MSDQRMAQLAYMAGLKAGRDAMKSGSVANIPAVPSVYIRGGHSQEWLDGYKSAIDYLKGS